ncbi:hypothetical protein [Actinomadura rudentiformis]|nr:hypothetical protein [Actinomadura rudentiformis]
MAPSYLACRELVDVVTDYLDGVLRPAGERDSKTIWPATPSV